MLGIQGRRVQKCLPLIMSCVLKLPVFGIDSWGKASKLSFLRDGRDAPAKYILYEQSPSIIFEHL